MTMTLPTAINLHTTNHNADARQRGNVGGTSTGTKANGNLPISGAAAREQHSVSADPGQILHWEFAASPSRDVSSDTLVLVWTFQFNAPNRIQCDTVANNGLSFRISSGSGSPPANYKHFQIGGNDTVAGSARQNPRAIVIDLNDTSNEQSGGTFDNTDVQVYAIGTRYVDLFGGSSILQFYQRAFLFTTTKNSADIPRFTGASDWDDLVDLVNGADYTDKISDEWAFREGSVYGIACPIEFGDNSVETDFNDNGAIVFFPDSDTATDPRVRVTSQAFRVYANLRDNVADTIILTGSYNCGNSNPDWDFDLDLACTITMNGASFTNVGTFTIGSSVTAAATFDGCGLVQVNNNGADLDGSTFRNPLGNHLLAIPL